SAESVVCLPSRKKLERLPERRTKSPYWSERSLMISRRRPRFISAVTTAIVCLCPNQPKRESDVRNHRADAGQTGRGGQNGRVDEGVRGAKGPRLQGLDGLQERQEPQRDLHGRGVREP